MEYCDKFRPIKPGSPHLNSKVESLQGIDLEEVYHTFNLNDPRLENDQRNGNFSTIGTVHIVL